MEVMHHVYLLLKFCFHCFYCLVDSHVLVSSLSDCHIIVLLLLNCLSSLAPFCIWSLSLRLTVLAVCASISCQAHPLSLAYFFLQQTITAVGERSRRPSDVRRCDLVSSLTQSLCGRVTPTQCHDTGFSASRQALEKPEMVWWVSNDDDDDVM